ncbi:Protein PELPK2 [Glycine max]|nr:hypothetical protein JHK85_021113 [Glycine max]KAG5024765.1 hypothetical protein JHK86_020679 [Glycine max]KAH1236307.1 Protein PELPK2 [Glycine max]
MLGYQTHGMASHYSCIILAFVIAISFSSIDMALASRNLLQTTLPTLPQGNVPPLPVFPNLPLPPFSFPNIPIPKIPNIPNIPSNPIIPTIPTIPFLSPPPSTTTTP